MSGGRVSIPNNVRKTIHNIKEITGNHSEDEIYAMLKECSMDPNETAQKLLLQDPFHEVKRKRDRKKENLSKEATEPKWKPGMQGRGNRGGRGNYSSRHISNDPGGGRKFASAKENGINQGAEDGVKPLKPQGQKIKETVVASSSDIIAENTRIVPAAHSSVGIIDKKQPEVSKSEAPLPQITPTEAIKTPLPSPSPGVYLSDSDPILMPSKDSRLSVGTIRREVGSKRIPVEQVHDVPVEIKSTASGSKVENSSMQVKATSEVQGVGKNLVSESSRPNSSSHVPFAVARPSSNFNNRAQQAIGPQKVGPSMEWKPKPTTPNPAQGTASNEPIMVTTTPIEVQTPILPAPTNLDSKSSATRELAAKLEESHISSDQHVIIPNHLHVPEADKLGFCFGSFDASFGFNATSSNGPVCDKSSEVTEEVDEEIIEEQPRNQNVVAIADEGDHPDRPTPSNNIPENLSPEGDMSSNTGTEYREPKQETSSLPMPGHQYPVVQTSPNFSFGFMPPMIGSHLTSFDNNDSQPRDGSHVPNFIVQQPFDAASYYAQFYSSGGDNDGRMSPFHSAGVQNKYNGNVPVLSPQASQSSQEVGNSLMLSSGSPTPIASQAGGMQSSIAVTQQPLPVFRQPPGVHLPHYPPNYIPYGPYFSPFYVPPHAIHQFLSNGTFPQQPQAGNMYPAPPVATPKYPISQYKPGSNAGNSGHIGMPGSYAPYGSSNPGYNPGSATTAGNSTSNEDLGGSQFKESNVYITGQQSEGSGVWIAGPGRDMSGLQASSFYNLPQGGQVAYTPTQPGHGPFTNIYHPAQPVTTGAVHPLLQQSQTLAGAAVDMVGPTAPSVYQQPQPTQINWPNNY